MKVLLKTVSKNEGYKEIKRLGGSGSYAKIAFMDFTMERVLTEENKQGFFSEDEIHNPVFGIYGQSTYHPESQIKETFKTGKY